MIHFTIIVAANGTAGEAPVVDDAGAAEDTTGTQQEQEPEEEPEPEEFKPSVVSFRYMNYKWLYQRLNIFIHILYYKCIYYF